MKGALLSAVVMPLWVLAYAALVIVAAFGRLVTGLPKIGQRLPARLLEEPNADIIKKGEG